MLSFSLPDFFLSTDGDRDEFDLLIFVRICQLKVDDTNGAGLGQRVPRDGSHGELLALGLVRRTVVRLEHDVLKIHNF